MHRWLAVCLLPSLTLACSAAEGGLDENAGAAQEEVDHALGARGYVGTVELMIHDDTDGSVNEHLFLRLDDGTRLQLQFDAAAGVVPVAQARQRVRVLGEREGSALFVERVELDSGLADAAGLRGEGARQLQQGLGAPPALPDIITVDQKVAVVLLSFQGASSPYDPEEMRQAVFGTGRSTSEFYQEGSRGKVKLIGVQDLAGDVYGPLNLSTNGCPGGRYADSSDEARSMLSGMGVNLGDYDKFVWYFPPNASGCPGGGVGGGDSAWIFGIGINAAWDYVSHELGHAFGLPHAASYNSCTSGNSPVTIGGSCGHDEYGDPTDVMGRRNFQFSSFHFERLGWLEPQNVLVLEESARVVLAPITLASSTVQSLRIPREGGSGADSMLHLEYRQQLGFDERLENTLVDGVLVRLVSDPLGRGTPHLLDMTPGSRNGADDFIDATLTPGRSLEDGNVVINVVAVTADTATVDVSFDGVPPDTGNPQGVGGTNATTTTGGDATTTGTTGGMGMGGASSSTAQATSSTGATSTTGSFGGASASDTGTTTTSPTGTATSASATTGAIGVGGASGSATTAGMGTTTGVPGATTGATGATGATGTPSSTATTGLTGPAVPNAPPVDDSGCACRTAAAPDSPSTMAAGLLLLGLALGRRRRRC